MIKMHKTKNQTSQIEVIEVINVDNRIDNLINVDNRIDNPIVMQLSNQIDTEIRIYMFNHHNNKLWNQIWGQMRHAIVNQMNFMIR